MADDEQFEPRLGRMRHQGGKRARSYLSRVLAATNLARGGGSAPAARTGFTGSRIGRGAGIGRMLSRRGGTGAWTARRVIIKTSIVKLAGKGAAGAAAHLRYLQRDGTTREGEPGTLYGPHSDAVDGKEFRERGTGDRHQFRFIVSPEDGAEYDNLKPLTRNLMARVEQDLGTTLDWVAVDHYNTGHPHSHIIVRGKDQLGHDLVIARDYLTQGMRERAAELVDLDLGPRSADEISRTLRAEVGHERLTSLDRALLRDLAEDRIVHAQGKSVLDQSLRAGRIAKLQQLGLAEPVTAGRWRLDHELEETLRGMGERGDIIRTMQREFTRAALDRPAADRAIYDPSAAGAGPLVGRLIARGLADEQNDRHFLLVDATDGRSHYVAIGRGDAVEPLPVGAIVRIEPLTVTERAVDRTVAAVAAANGGHYDVEAHLRHSTGANQDFAETHVRRLESLRRAGAGVARDPSGIWTIAPDHLERVAVHEARMLRDRPVDVQLLSLAPVEKLIDTDAATWLDRETLAERQMPLRDAGFGKDVSGAQIQRRQWLISQGLAEEASGVFTYRADLLATLQRRELLRVAGQLSKELALPFAEARKGMRLDGVIRRPVDLVSGRFALVERSRDFTLVPWRPLLQARIGQSVSGIIREAGVNWTLGRGRSGPTIS